MKHLKKPSRILKKENQGNSSLISESNGIHYAWFVLVGGALLIFLCLGLASNLMGIFLTPLMDEFGFGRTKASSILGVLTFMPLVSVITTDALYKKFPIKPCICAFVLGMAIGMFMLSKSTNLIQCYISVILVGYCLGSAGMISVTTLINRWFYEKRGLAIGIVTSSSGLANMIMPNIMINFIELYGVRTAIGIHSVLMLCVGIIIF